MHPLHHHHHHYHLSLAPQVFSVARQALSLVAGDAIDVYLLGKLRLLRQEHAIARAIQSLQVRTPVAVIVAVAHAVTATGTGTVAAEAALVIGAPPFVGAPLPSLSAAVPIPSPPSPPGRAHCG